MVSNRERILGGLWGSLVGDALGVPVEFMSRIALHANPVEDMCSTPCMQASGVYLRPIHFKSVFSRRLIWAEIRIQPVVWPVVWREFSTV